MHNNSRIKDYCPKCQVFICRQCRIELHSDYFHHSKSRKIIVNTYVTFNAHRNFKCLDSMINEYKSKTSTVLSLLNNNRSHRKEFITSLDFAFDNYLQNNNILKSFALILQRNSEVLKQYSNYNMYANTLYNFNINESKPLLKNKNPVEDARSLIEYFHTNCFYAKQRKMQISSMVSTKEFITSIIKTEDFKLVTSTTSGLINVWNIQPMYPECVLRGHTGAIFKIIQLRDERIVSGGWDCKIIVWDLKKENKKAKILIAHRKFVNSLLQLKDNTLASSSRDKTIKIWDINSFVCLNVFLTVDDAPVNLCLLENGNYAASMANKSIAIWNGKEHTLLSKLHGNKDFIFSLIALKNQRLASSSKDCTVIIWNTRTYTQISSIEFKFPISNLIGLNDDTIMMSSYDLVQKLDLHTMKIFEPLNIKSNTLYNFPNTSVNLEDGRITVCIESFILIIDI